LGARFVRVQDEEPKSADGKHSAVPPPPPSSGSEFRMAVPDPTEATSDPVLLDIYRSEVSNHLQNVRQFLEACAGKYAPYAVTEALHRACHTLAGASKMAGARQGIKLTEPLNRLAEEDYTQRCRQAALAAWDTALSEATGPDAAYLASLWAEYQDLEAPARLDRCMGYDYLNDHVYRLVDFAAHGQRVLQAALAVWKTVAGRMPSTVYSELLPAGRNPVDALGALEWDLGEAHRAAQDAGKEAIGQSDVVLASRVAAKQAAGKAGDVRVLRR